MYLEADLHEMTTPRRMSLSCLDERIGTSLLEILQSVTM